MKKLFSMRWISLLMAVIMIIGSIPLSVFAFGSANIDTEKYNEFLTSLTALEGYADEYAREHAGEDATALVINYIRCGVEKYTSGTWTTFCGQENTQFKDYVSEQDAANGTKAVDLRSLSVFTLPNGNQVDFAHMFGAMDMSYHTGNQSTADLGSWAGDICDLLELTTKAGVTGSVEEMAEEIRTNKAKYFLYDAPDAHSFGILDLYGDLDAFYILKKIGGGVSISSVMKNYFTTNLTDAIRAKFFLDNRFDRALKKNDIRDCVYNTYVKNEGIRALEGNYLSGSVNTDLRRACCYAFADYLYETAKDLLENDYYSVFSSESSLLAPGIKQEIKKSIAKDGKQLSYYIATADITRSDVSVHANYKDNNGSVWGMARVRDQMNAAETKHTNPNEAKYYVPNYSAVVGVNADFYNMSNGAPAGALVMEGTTYHSGSESNFFAVLKDGTPVIGAGSEWNKYKDNIQEAVGGSIMLVKDGEVVVKATDNYYRDRVSRTCVGITYDGQIVLMVLDGRQEPYSAGGSAIEIAQVMKDAGCVTAMNLDGGGSSTFAAKGEGSEKIAVVNRPSDGCDRSVSSSLLVVSTAKPSNVFDHAIVSADYDYLTVGTDLTINTTGVTSTGGAIALPEGAKLQVSDESIGTLDGNVFTAKALGDVQIQLVDSDGSILGVKALHIVNPTDLKFTKDTLNAVYGEPAELPLEATYNNNPVKINADDVTFCFLKVEMKSVGNMEGSSINTTVTTLEYDKYPEAGEISGFDFIPKVDSTLRTLTIGAQLTSKEKEFEDIFCEEFERARAEAIAKKLKDEEANNYAETAANNKVLEASTKITAYFYKSDEANFDFNNATGVSKLFAWNREVSNSNYKDDERTYYQINSQTDMDMFYTFAVDMSKMPIPDKLTGLLYMIPGGTQEGRTAWDFLLQLAERVSRLTTVTITLNAPEGVTFDTTNIRLANEYFNLTSATVKGNKLTVVCNFIVQSKPINPATANPLCVLSGLKLVSTDDANWDEKGLLNCTVSGELAYDIFAHFHVLESLGAKPEYQKDYGLYSYSNRDEDPNDYGAHFFDTVTKFEDNFKLQLNNKDGWIREDGKWSYWQDGEAMTGIHKLPNHEGATGEYWYDLGSDGISKGKITGLFTYDGNLYYAVTGTTQSGWREIDGKHYYFNPSTFTAVDGVQRISTKINNTGNPQYDMNLTYTFENHVLVRGALITLNTGRRYYWAGEVVARKWQTVDGKRYFFGDHGDALVGFSEVPKGNSGQGADYYLFDNEGALIVQPGMYKLTSDLPHIASGYVAGDIVFFDDTGKAISTGLIYGDDGYLYYIIADDVGHPKAVRNGKPWITEANANGLVNPGHQRTFDDQGRMIAKNGIYLIEPANKYLGYYINDDLQRNSGLVRMADGRMIYVNSDDYLYCSRTFNVTKTNGLIPAGKYYFDNVGILQYTGWVTCDQGRAYYENGIMRTESGWAKIDNSFYYFDDNGYVLTGEQRLPYPTADILPGYAPDAEDAEINVPGNPRNPEDYDYPDHNSALFFFDDKGVFQKDLCKTYDDNGVTRWVENGMLIWHAGLVKDGDDYRYFKRNGMVNNVETYVAKTNGWLEPARYIFDEDGKMMQLEGLNKDLNGDPYYFVKYTKTYAGLIEVDGNYYYVNSYCQLVKNCTYYVFKTNGLMPIGHYVFDEDGKMVIKNGLVEENGDLYYYVDGVKVIDSLVEWEGNYYYIGNQFKAVKNTKHYIAEDNTNGFVPAGGYWFNEDGTMFLNGIREENGKKYYYKDGVKNYAGLIEIDGAYYYVKSDCSIVCDRSYYVTKTNGLMKNKTYIFGADGKMIMKNGIYREMLDDGKKYLFYYVDNERQMNTGLVQLEDGSYIYVRSGADLAIGEYKVYKTNGLLPQGTYTFGEDGKMIVSE